MTHYIGNDISKRDFHSAFAEDMEALKFTNDPRGIREFIRWMKQAGYLPGSTIVGMESTGSYHLMSALMCRRAGYQVNIINPLIVKKQNQTSLRRVKNDRKDARLIRHCLTAGAGYPFMETEETIQLKTLVRQRNYFSGLRLRLKLRQQNMDLKESSIGTLITPLNRDLYGILTARIKELDKKLGGYCGEVQKLLRTIPGVGPQTAVSFISEVGEIKRFSSPEKLTAFIGLDPRTHESGTSIHGKGYITKRGNKILRTRLYNAASVAVIHPPNLFHDFFQKKRSEGKPYQVALCAVMRKMVHVIHAVWSRETPFINQKK